MARTGTPSIRSSRASSPFRNGWPIKKLDARSVSLSIRYKPDARTNRPIAQLTIYALALTRRIPGLKLFDIKCAWFNEDQCCEFFPRTLLAADHRAHKNKRLPRG